MHACRAVNECDLRSRPEQLKQLSQSLAQILKRYGVTHQGLIGSIELNVEMFQTNFFTHLGNSLGLFFYGLGSYDHGHIFDLFEQASTFKGGFVPQHKFGFPTDCDLTQSPDFNFIRHFLLLLLGLFLLN